MKTSLLKFLNEEKNNNDLESLIKKALKDAYVLLEKQIPQTKKKTETISIIKL
jgi:hypothetical protein